MKMIVAYLQPERVEAVKQALVEAGIFAMTLFRAEGCGQQRGKVGLREQGDAGLVMRSKVRLEAAVRDGLVDAALDAIVSGARTYHLGDGMIFVYDIADCMRIRTRARGAQALEQKPVAAAARPGAATPAPS